jgi:O-antigen/teichoic acid export membrane protein
MGAEPLGYVAFGLSFVALFTFLADLNFYQAHVKRISEGKDLGKCIGTYLSIKILLAMLMCAVVITSIFVWKEIFHRGFHDPIQETIVYVCLIYYVLGSLAQIPGATYIGRRQIAKQQLPMLIITSLRVFSTILVAVFSWGTVALAGTYAIGALFGLLFTLFIFVYHKYPIARPNMEYFKSYFSFALPLMVVSWVGIIAANIDKVIIQLFWTPTDVGYFFGVQRITFFVLALSSSVGLVLFPTISKQHAKKDVEGIRRITYMGERYLSMIICPLVVFIIVFSPQIINILLSSAFLPAVPILRILAIYALIGTMSTAYGQQLIGTDHPGLAAKIGLVCAIIGICLNMILIPRSVFGVELLGLATRSNWRILIHLLAAVITGIFAYFLSSLNLVDVFRWYHLIAYGLSCLGVFFSVLYLAREFKKEDFKFFIDTLNLKGMAGYIVGEMKGKNEED